MTIAIWLLFALTVKHFLADFPLQFPFMYKNKGIYGHLGGVAHALVHFVGTGWVFVLFGFAFLPCVLLAALDSVVHYHVDWTKYYINRKMGWTPTTTDYFWYLLGLDQLLHYLTYFLLVWIAMPS